MKLHSKALTLTSELIISEFSYGQLITNVNNRNQHPSENNVYDSNVCS